MKRVLRDKGRKPGTEVIGCATAFSRHLNVKRAVSKWPLKSSVTGVPPAPYSVQLEVNCEECGGSGFDPGGVDPWGPEECPKCRGGKKQTITRNYLAEAFRIAANPESIRQVEREHLVAIIHHCRETVRALMSLPEVA